MENIQIIDLFLERNEMAIHEVSKKYTHFCFGIAWNILSNSETEGLPLSNVIELPKQWMRQN